MSQTLQTPKLMSAHRHLWSGATTGRVDLARHRLSRSKVLRLRAESMAGLHCNQCWYCGKRYSTRYKLMCGLSYVLVRQHIQRDQQHGRVFSDTADRGFPVHFRKGLEATSKFKRCNKYRPAVKTFSCCDDSPKNRAVQRLGA